MIKRIYNFINLIILKSILLNLKEYKMLKGNIQMEIDIAKNQQEFIRIYKENIKREGASELLDWLLKTDFFTAPASTKFHSSFEGGLCFHTLNVYKRFKDKVAREFKEGTYSDETIAIIALLHDICKVDCYKVEYRNAKVDNEWVKVPYYSFVDNLPYGHGEKSVYMISGFMKLSREESMAINWHMGGFDTRVIGGSYSLSSAYYQYPLSVVFHSADIEATYLDEVSPK